MHAFEDHLDHVLIAVIARAHRYVTIENEDIHERRVAAIQTMPEYRAWAVMVVSKAGENSVKVDACDMVFLGLMWLDRIFRADGLARIFHK